MKVDFFYMNARSKKILNQTNTNFFFNYFQPSKRDKSFFFFFESLWKQKDQSTSAKLVAKEIQGNKDKPRQELKKMRMNQNF